ncbi:MAG: trimethylamine methyltransferase family protein [Anaerolineae bacterium]|jgi:trimethylamine--corrinoid protein Co-methyltransferase
MEDYKYLYQPPQFSVLSLPQIEKLVAATLECLERTGLHILNAEARELLATAGARVDGIRVRFPPSLIEDAIATAPRDFRLWGRPGTPAEDQFLQVGYPRPEEEARSRVYFGPGPTCPYFVDPESGLRRRTRRGDPGLTALVCDALDNIDYVMSLGLIDDVTPLLAPVYEFAEMVAHTSKPVLPWAYSVENVTDIYHIALAVAGSREVLRERPFLALFTTFHSPLTQTNEDLANAFCALDHDIPVIMLGGATAGTSGPVTGAGSLVVGLAGALGGLAILQLKAPGVPVCLGNVPEAMDLLTCVPAYGSPEMSLYSAAVSDVMRHLDLPFMGTAGASEAKTLDLQAAIESTFQVLLSGLSGATLVHDVGFLDCANIGSLESLVMNDEIIAMARRVMRGIDISDETLMLDLIDRVGPGGEFISSDETARLCRTEIWHPKLLDRQSWFLWEEKGQQTMHHRIQARLRKILALHKPPPLPGSVQDRIDEILTAAEARHAVSVVEQLAP